MPAHVVYACNCLNVKIHLANKYYLEGHENFRKDKFTRLEEPSISGWKFELSMKGISVEYTSLIRLRYIMDNSEGWVTISCHNCSTGDVYSVRRDNKPSIIYPIDKSILNQPGDQVIVHKGTIFGLEIERLQKKAIYSTAFHIVLNPDLPINNLSLDKEEILNAELKIQYEEVKELLQQSLKDLEEKTEKRIQAYREEQEILLTREKQKAIYDSAVLWQTMKEISKTVNEENEHVRRLSVQKVRNSVSDQILFNRIANDAYFNPLEDTNKQALNNLTEIQQQQQQQQQRKVVRRSSSSSLSAGFNQQYVFVPSSFTHNYRRKSSYILDENAITNSLNKTVTSPLHLAPVHEMPPFHRRRSLLVPEQQPSLHPLAQLAEEQTNCKISASSTSSSWVDDDDHIEEEKGDEEEEEDLFPLDEDIKSNSNTEEKSFSKAVNHTSNRDNNNNRRSSKYIDFVEEEEEEEEEVKRERNHSLLMKQSLKEKENKQGSNFATSVPISISYSPATNENKLRILASSSFNNKTLQDKKSRKPSFIGFDYAEADRRTSLTFSSSQLDDRRRKSVLHNQQQRQGLNSTKNKLELELEENDDHIEEGPMIPPHILAANTATNETEVLFGSVPHSSTRNRLLE
ncbi:uncharacterized protein BX663DRAFT_484484 [Cokeromyces recurvatus]|uniref:uncharacterized protein n=1 Tax=Cokeromyces recurvatus TaxID=90255 RepID=UPI00221EC0FD|nr:uncharacterized protein BX663DRAFT_484484 [Cokeromyces recurvatus]KAI7905176.1 hypothetical protein BX663DRAFT_484484 [Cokeromyces recurvatus]